METKRQISWYRRQVKAMIAEGQGRGLDTQEYEGLYNAIALQIRTHMDIESLNSLLEKHKDLHNQTLKLVQQVDKTENDDLKTQKMSSTSDERVTHYNLTNQELSDKSVQRSSHANTGFRESVTRPVAGNLHQPEQGESEETKGSGVSNPGGAGGGAHETSDPDVVTATGLQHITLKQALNAASSRLRDHLPLQSGGLTWADMVNAAWKLRPELGISQKSWGEACLLLGRTGAAVCLILTDQAAQREQDRVMKPGAYFHAMINKARSRELHLHKSVFGILKREETA
jgi:hypothetical protein